jgi:hypothetical protein
MGNDPNLPVAALTSKVRLTRGGTSRLVLLLFLRQWRVTSRG